MFPKHTAKSFPFTVPVEQTNLSGQVFSLFYPEEILSLCAHAYTLITPTK